MGLLEIAFPVRHGRRYGIASGALLVLVVFGEVEALALVALGLVAHRFDLFVALQPAIAPAGFLVALVSAAAVALQQRVVHARVRRYVAQTADLSAFADRLATRRPADR